MFRVVGLSDLIAALNATDREMASGLRARLKEAGDVVARDAATRLADLDPSPTRSVAGVVVRVRSAGLITVEQKLRKTTGTRPDWGATQMRDAFLPAQDAEQEKVAALVQQAVDDTATKHGF